MTTEQFANNATSTLNGTITSIQTTLVVTSVALFPSVPQFRIIIDSEIMLVTGVSATTFTVTRGSENTTQASHTTGAAVSMILTSGALQQLSSDIRSSNIVLSSFASRPGTGLNGQTFVPSDGGYQQIWDGSQWRPLVNGILCTQPPVAASWTVFNAPGSIADSNGSVIVTGINEVSGPERGYVISGTTSAEALMSQYPFAATAASTASTAQGVIARESATTKFFTFTMTVIYSTTALYGGGPQTPALMLQTYDNATAISRSVVFDGNIQLFIRVRVSGANIIAETSFDRNTWKQFDSRTLASIYTVSPNQMGVTTQSNQVLPQFSMPHFIGV